MCVGLRPGLHHASARCRMVYASWASDRLKQWNDEFGALELSPVHIEIRFFRQFILLRIRPNDLGNVAPAAIELAKRVRVGLLFCENL